MTCSLHGLVQECSRAIASHPVPTESYPDLVGILTEKTGAREAAVFIGGAHPGASAGIAARAIDERRVCVESSTDGIYVAAPVKNGGRVFGALWVSYGRSAAHASSDHSTSEVLGAIGMALGNALALAERVPPTNHPALGEQAYGHYVRAHWELYRSFRVPFSIVAYNVHDRSRLARISAAAALRWTVRCSDAVFALEGDVLAVVLTNCPLSGARIAAERIARQSGLLAAKLTAPRRGESARRLQHRAISLKEHAALR